MSPTRSTRGLRRTPTGPGPLPWKATLRQALDLLFFSAAFGLLFNLFFPYGIELKAPPPKDRGLMDDLKADRGQTPSYAGFRSGASSPAAAQASPTPPPSRDVVRLSLSGVKARFDAGTCVFLDARSPEEYGKGHIPGALNFDADHLDLFAPRVLPHIPDKGREIVCYCHGGDCDLALQVAHTLLEQGYRRVEVFQGGWPAWKKAGYPEDLGENP